MKGHLMNLGKAALAATVTLLAVQHGAGQLPAKLQVAGVDVRPYAVGTAVMFAMFAVGKSVPVVKPG